MRNRRRKEVEVKKKRRRAILFTLGVLVLVYLSLTLIFRENGLLKYLKLRDIRAERQSEIRGLKKQNEEINRQIEALKTDPNLLEELARKQGLKREEELIFRFEDEK